MITFRAKSLVDADPVRCRCEELSTTSHEYRSSAHIIFDAPGNSYNLLTNSSPYPSNPLSPILTSSCNRDQFLGHHLTDNPVYPSPPSTSSQPGRSVPLPNDCCKTPVVERPLESQSYFGGILDSPPIVEHCASQFQGPLSPPPTLPTQTLSLPPAEYDQPQLKEMDARGFFNSCQSNALIQRDDETCPHPLSPPLSPDWDTTKVPFPMSTQSSLFFPTIAYPTPLFLNNENSYISNFRPFDLYLDDLYAPSTRQWPTNVAMDCRALDALSSHVSHLGLLCSPEQEDLNLTSDDGLSVSPRMDSFPSPTWRLDELDSTLCSPLFPYPGSPPTSSPASSNYEFDYHDYDDGPMPPLSPPSSPSLRLFSELPTFEGENDHPCHDEMLGLSTQDEYFYNPAPPNLSQTKSTERAPAIRSFPGVEIDDDLIPVDLASRSSVPEHCIVIPSTPYITPSTLVPFPESLNVDSNIDSQQLGEAATRFRGSSLLLYDDRTFASGSSSRIDTELDQLDPVLVASDAELKRLLDLRSRALASEKRARMVEAQYENIRAYRLRDGANGLDDSVEHEAQLYQQEEGRMQALLAVQAKRERKREKERQREISTLVKIKLRERGISFKRTPPSPPAGLKSEDMDADGIFVADGFLQDSDVDDSTMTDHTDRRGQMKSNKDAVTTMPQLVARMILKRREARVHPVARPKFGRTSARTNDVDSRGRSHRSSPLTLPASTNQDEAMMEQDDDIQPHVKDHRLQYSPLQWHMDVDCHTCPDSAISNLDDLDIGSNFNLLSLSDI